MVAPGRLETGERFATELGAVAEHPASRGGRNQCPSPWTMADGGCDAGQRGRPPEARVGLVAAPQGGRREVVVRRKGVSGADVAAIRRRMASPPAGTLKFLGTAGARFAVATQLRHSGGLVWTLGGVVLWVDPGPGALVRALSSRPKIDPAKTDAVLLTHPHLDHVGDATAVIEAMTGGGFRRRGALLAPKSALEDDPVVFRYAQGFVARREHLRAGGSYTLGPDLTVVTPLAHDHGIETYGYRLETPGFAAAHVVDTFWMDELASAYAGVDLLIVNTTRLAGRDPRYRHLGADDAEALAAAVRPRLCVLTHFGMQLPPARAHEVALGISARTGVATLAARDGWRLDLAEVPALGRGDRPAEHAPR
jgi:ribonuclease BN (tRNA processing enzyme)